MEEKNRLAQRAAMMQTTEQQMLEVLKEIRDMFVRFFEERQQQPAKLEPKRDKRK